MRMFMMIFALIGFAQSATAQEMTEAQIKSLALQAILENPEIIMQAVGILEQRERDRQNALAVNAMVTLEIDPNAMIMGNPDGDVTIVEFFDYNCGYCRRSGPVVQAILDSDPNVKVILREWPVLGEESVFAARAALAARKQGVYNEFHKALMLGEGRASEALVVKTARDLGMDADQLLADMNDPAVATHLAQSQAFAQNFGFTGTPAFIIGGQIAPGFMELDQMLAAIEAARADG